VKLAKEDLLWIRTYIAEKHGKELTPQQVLEILKKVKQVEISDEPGLLSSIERGTNGDSSPC
jgi:hypothetical protein